MLTLTILAILAAAGVSVPIFGKLASAGSQKQGKASQSFWDWLKGIFKKGANAPSNTVAVAGPDGVNQEQLYSGDVVNPALDGQANQDATSAQTVNQPADVATQAAQNQATGDGGSAQNSSDAFDTMKKILGFLGLTEGFLGNKENYGWMQDYGSIVGDERAYGSEMINDARRWQEYMSGTAYQRTVKDIEAAGLNPWLALQSGGINPVSYGAVDTGSALGSISTSLSQSISQGNSNSSSAIIVALIAMLAKMFMS